MTTESDKKKQVRKEIEKIRSGNLKMAGEIVKLAKEITKDANQNLKGVKGNDGYSIEDWLKRDIPLNSRFQGDVYLTMLLAIAKDEEKWLKKCHAALTKAEDIAYHTSNQNSRD